MKGEMALFMKYVRLGSLLAAISLLFVMISGCNGASFEKGEDGSSHFTGIEYKELQINGTTS